MPPSQWCLLLDTLTWEAVSLSSRAAEDGHEQPESTVSPQAA